MGHCDKKKPPLSPSNLNSCHIDNLLHWDVQIPDTSSPLCNVKHQEGKYSVRLSRFMWPWNLLTKLIFHGTHLEKYHSRYSQFKLCHTQLWAWLWKFNKGSGVTSSWQKASQLTFPAPTGPTTAKSSPGLAIRKRSCRVGVPDAYKREFIKKKSPFQ